MKQHSGIRPLDILILIQLSLYRNKDWLDKDVAAKLKISASEISEYWQLYEDRSK